jgi:hypothetical protein
LFLIICIFFADRGKINFGFDGSDTKPSSVDPLASKSGRKGLDKSKGKAYSSLLEKRTRSGGHPPKKDSGKGPCSSSKGSYRQVSSSSIDKMRLGGHSDVFGDNFRERVA